MPLRWNVYTILIRSEKTRFTATAQCLLKELGHATPRVPWTERTSAVVHYFSALAEIFTKYCKKSSLIILLECTTTLLFEQGVLRNYL